jgi:hypothetical protein
MKTNVVKECGLCHTEFVSDPDDTSGTCVVPGCGGILVPSPDAKHIRAKFRVISGGKDDLEKRGYKGQD